MVEAREAGLGPLNETCIEQAHILLPPFSIISNYTAEDKERIHRLERNETEPSLTFGEVVIPSETWFGIWWDTMVRRVKITIKDETDLSRILLHIHIHTMIYTGELYS